MPVASMARPMSPPSASISRTRWPFAVPPIAGLHGMCATVSVERVQKPTCAPSRAAACAASQPAWPAPITMTSNERLTVPRLTTEHARHASFDRLKMSVHGELVDSADGELVEPYSLSLIFQYRSARRCAPADLPARDGR